MKKWINAIVQACYKWAKASGIIVIVMCMVGCQGIEAETTTDKGVDIVVIEGCEYLKCYTYYNNYVYTHKGNCKNHTTDTVYIPVPSESHSQIK